VIVNIAPGRLPRALGVLVVLGVLFCATHLIGPAISLAAESDCSEIPADVELARAREGALESAVPPLVSVIVPASLTSESPAAATTLPAPASAVLGPDRGATERSSRSPPRG